MGEYLRRNGRLLLAALVHAGHAITLRRSLVHVLLRVSGGGGADAVVDAVVDAPGEHLQLRDDDHLVGGSVQRVAHVVRYHRVERPTINTEQFEYIEDK